MMGLGMGMGMGLGWWSRNAVFSDGMTDLPLVVDIQGTILLQAQSRAASSIASRRAFPAYSVFPSRWSSSRL